MENENDGKVSRRAFLKGLASGLIVGIIAGAGVAAGIIPPRKPETSYVYIPTVKTVTETYTKTITPTPSPTPTIPKELEEIFTQLVPEASSFKPVIGAENIPIYFEIYDSAGKLIGFAFYIEEVKSISDKYKIWGALDLDYKILSIKIEAKAIMPGEEPWFKKDDLSRFMDEFRGLSVDEIKLSEEDGKVDAITGATLSSRLITDTIRSKVKEVIETRK